VELSKLMIEKLPDTEVVKEGWVYQDLALACMALGRWEEAIEAWKGYVNRSTSANEDIDYIISYLYYKWNNDVDKLRTFYIVGRRVELFLQNKYKNEIIEIAKKYPIKGNETKFEYVVRTAMYFESFLRSKGEIISSDEEVIDFVRRRSKKFLDKYNVKFE